MKELYIMKISMICLLIQTTFSKITFNESVDLIGDNISIISFVIILIANWTKVIAQVKKWYRKLK